MAILFGLLSGLFWGAGDFCGGLASRRANVYAVIAASQLASILLMALPALILGEHLPTAGSLVLSGLSGLAGALGLLALYRALASGQMGVAAPVSAVLGAALPVIFSAVLEGRPTSNQSIGFGLALLAVGFISYNRASGFRLRELGLPLAAGLGFGSFFILINLGSQENVLWPLVVSKVASLAVILGIAGLGRQPLSPPRSILPLIVWIALGEVGGNVFFVLAGQAGRLDVATILASMYPATTVLLAWLVLKERLNRMQAVGVGAALAAIVLIAGP